MTIAGNSGSKGLGSRGVQTMAVMACLYFVFGLVSWMNAVLIPYFKVACDLHTEVQSYLVTFAFNIAYLLIAIPASVFLDHVGYRRGASAGLGLLSFGALLFWPAALQRSYFLFLVALFLMGMALAILQTLANPLVVTIGPRDSAARRISIVGICNKLAGILSPLVIAELIIRSQDRQTMASIDSGMLSGVAKEQALDQMVRGVIVPYVILALVLLLLGILFYFSPIPDEGDLDDDVPRGEDSGRKSVLSYPYLVLGAIAMFCHLGAIQVSVSTLVSYSMEFGRDLISARIFPSLSLSCVLIGYFCGIIMIPRVISQATALKVCSSLGLFLSVLVLFLPPMASVVCLVLLGLPNSLIYAGIWPLAIRNLGKWKNLGSAILVMSFCGNAVLPLIYGSIADVIGKQLAYIILIPCFLYLIYYAFKGHKVESWK